MTVPLHSLLFPGFVSFLMKYVWKASLQFAFHFKPINNQPLCSIMSERHALMFLEDCTKTLLHGLNKVMQTELCAAINQPQHSLCLLAVAAY